MYLPKFFLNCARLSIVYRPTQRSISGVSIKIINGNH